MEDSNKKQIKKTRKNQTQMTRGKGASQKALQASKKAALGKSSAQTPSRTSAKTSSKTSTKTSHKALNASAVNSGLPKRHSASKTTALPAKKKTKLKGAGGRKIKIPFLSSRAHAQKIRERERMDQIQDRFEADQKAGRSTQEPKIKTQRPRLNLANQKRPYAVHRKPQVQEWMRSTPILSPQLIAMRMGQDRRGRNTLENRYFRLSNRGLSPELQKELPKAPANSVKIIPLGGLCEIGKNMTAYEYGNDIIVVDVGVSFPTEEQPGVDAIIPAMDYIFEHKSKLRGVFLTHGHEDHIGSIQWLLKDVRCPVYGGPLTLALVRGKMQEHGLESQIGDLRVVRDGEVQKAGSFSVEFIHVNHSIADSSALAIQTPAGTIIHSGDFKIDYTPIHGKPIDLPRFSELGDLGVLLFVCESTNIGKEGFSMSESRVGREFSKQFDKAQGRVIVATFSSNVHRIQQVISAAEDHGRKVLLIGRSMNQVFNAADELGYIQYQRDTLIDLNELNQYPDDKICIIMTGSQGEKLAALSRIAYNEHQTIEIKKGDRIILSANTIPGNEKPIFNMVDELCKRGAEVIYKEMADVHVSGHAYREEIKLLHELVRPKYFVPCHGEYRMLHNHSELAHTLGMPYERIFLLNNGDICAFSENFAGVVGYTEGNPVLVDGRHRQRTNTSVLRERKELAEDGILVLTLIVNAKGELATDPSIVSMGFMFEEAREQFPQQLKRFILSRAQAAKSGQQSLSALFKQASFRSQILNLCMAEFGRKPVLRVEVVEL